MEHCPRCQSEKIVKNGRHLNRQRYKCNNCRFQFTRTTLRGRPANEKAMAVILYVSGLPMNAIAKLFKVSTPAVLYWIKKFAEKIYEKPAPKEAVIVELDEMWHYLKF